MRTSISTSFRRFLKVAVVRLRYLDDWTATGLSPTVDFECVDSNELGLARCPSIVRGANNSTGGSVEAISLDN